MASPPEQVVPFRDLKHMETLVIGLQGNPVSLAQPTDGDSLVWDGTEWAPIGLRLGITEADADTRYVRQSGGIVSGTLVFPDPGTGIDILDGSLHLTRSDLLMVGNTGLERIALSRTGSTATEGIPVVWSDSGSQLARIGAGRGAPGGNQGYLGVQVYNLLNNSWLNAWTTRQTGGQAWLQVYNEPVQPFDVATKQYVDGMVTEGSTVLIGVFEPDGDVCHYRADLPYLNPGPLVPADVAGAGAYLICDEAGTFPPASEAAGLTFVIGDWVISDGTDWVKLSVGTPNLSASAIAVFPNVAGQDNVQEALEAMLPFTGGQMQGPLELAANAAAPLQPVPLQQLTSTLLGYLPLTGGTLTGNLTVQRSDSFITLNSVGNGSRATMAWGNGTNNQFILYRNTGATALHLDRIDDAGVVTNVLAVNRNTGAIALLDGSTLTLTADAVFPLQPVTFQQANARYFPFTGGVFTGQVTLFNDATQPLNPVPLRQLDARFAAIPPNVSSFNTRTGAVTLTTADITGAGGAPINNPSFTGTITSNGGLSFGSSAVTTATNLTRHIALWGGGTPAAPTTNGFGFSITSNTLNYMVGATAAVHDFYASTTLLARISNSELAMQGARDVRARNFIATTDGFGLDTAAGGKFYKKVGTGVVIRQSSGNQQPQIENTDGSNARAILDTNNGVPVAGGTMTGSLTFNGANLGVSWGTGTNAPWGRIYAFSDKPIRITQDSQGRQPQIANNDGSSPRNILDSNNGVLKAGDTMTGTLTISAGGLTMGAGNVRLRASTNGADGGQVLQWQDQAGRTTGQINASQNGNVVGGNPEGTLEFYHMAGGYGLRQFMRSRLDVGYSKLVLMGPPTETNDAATKGYVDTTAAGAGPWQQYPPNSIAFTVVTGQVGIRSRLLNGGAFCQFEAQLTCVGGDWVNNQSRTLQSNTGYLPPGQRPDFYFVQAAYVTVGAVAQSVRLEVSPNGVGVIRNVSGATIPVGGNTILQFVVAIPVAPV